MLKIDRSPQRLVLKSGSTAAVLDKEAQQARLATETLVLGQEAGCARPLSSLTDVTVETNVDPASKAEISSVMLKLREGGGWMLTARDKSDAHAAVAAVREFLA